MLPVYLSSRSESELSDKDFGCIILGLHWTGKASEGACNYAVQSIDGETQTWQPCY